MTQFGEKAGLRWCNEHNRYETLFVVEPQINPHIPDDDTEGPAPDSAAYLAPSVPALPKREWVQ